MLKAIIQLSTNLTKKSGANNLHSSELSFYLAFKPKKVPSFATDGTGKHVAETKIDCDLPSCETKVCKGPCGKVVGLCNNGHFTHNPPLGVQSEFLDSQDFNGNATKKGQHFVKPTTKPTLSTEELKNLTEDDMQPNKLADAYAAMPHIFKKIK